MRSPIRRPAANSSIWSRRWRNLISSGNSVRRLRLAPMNDTATVRLDLPDQRTPDPLDIDTLAGRFRDRAAKIGVIGLGYVGLPLLRTAAQRGFAALGFDIGPATA